MGLFTQWASASMGILRNLEDHEPLKRNGDLLPAAECVATSFAFLWLLYLAMAIMMYVWEEELTHAQEDDRSSNVTPGQEPAGPSNSYQNDFRISDSDETSKFTDPDEGIQPGQSYL
eukprot:TRINITY_DN1363_c0_g1_i3.p1 TRINITY_DN1363_c0_g1~~TRINITY_DN1363_c0_g1_i3.p1  ORF type:complete len:117 (-),score=18.67 TRINITY_DN1363_c0_g1_i3:313-663(-)